MNKQELLNRYILDNSTGEDELLQQLSRETYLKAIYPRMISGALQGKLLEFISRMIGPKNILEIGTFTGYSALCLAKGLQSGGQLHTIEINDEIIYLPKKYFKKAGIDDKVKIHIGSALEIIPDLDLEFDLVFIDADKSQYTEYFNLTIDKVRPGGYILADNVLWDGKVTDPVIKTDKETMGIVAFNEMIKTDKRVENLILPLRDGISIIRKI